MTLRLIIEKTVEQISGVGHSDIERNSIGVGGHACPVFRMAFADCHARQKRPKTRPKTRPNICLCGMAE